MDKRTLDAHKESKTISTLKTELHRLEQVLAQQAKEFSAEREATENRVFDLQRKISVGLLENTTLKTENTSLHANLRKLNTVSSQEERSEKWCATCHALEQRLAADPTDKHTADAVKLATQELERKLKREQKQMEKTLQEKFEDRESELVGENKRLLKQLARANATKEQNENRAAIAISKSNDALIARLQTEASEHQQQASKHEDLIHSLKQQLESLQSEHASSAKRVKDAEQRVADLRLRQTSIERAKVAAETEYAQQLSELKSVHKAEKAKFEEQEKSKADASVLKAQRAEAARKTSEERVKEVQRQVTTLSEQLAADKQTHLSEIATLKSQLKAEAKKSASLLEQSQQDQQKLKEGYAKKLADQQKLHEQANAELKKQLTESGKTLKAQQLQQSGEAQACRQALEETLSQARDAHSQLQQQHQALNEQYQELEAIRVGLETTLREQTSKLDTIQKEYEAVIEKTRLELTTKHQSQLDGNKSEHEEKLRAVEIRSVDRVKELNETYVTALQRLGVQYEEKVAAIEAAHAQTLAERTQQAEILISSQLDSHKSEYEEKLRAVEMQSVDRVKELNETYVAALQRLGVQHEEKVVAIEVAHEILTKERDAALAMQQSQLDSNKSEYEEKLRAVEMQSVDRVKELNETYVAALQRLGVQYEEKVAAIEVAHAQTLAERTQQAEILTKERDETLATHQSQLDSNKSEYEEKLRAVEMQSVERVKELNETYVAALQRLGVQYEEKVAAIEATHAQTLAERTQQADILTKERDEALKQISTEQQSANEQFQQLQSDHATLKVELVRERETITNLQAAQKLELDNIIRMHEVKLAEVQASHNEAMVVLQELNKEQSDSDHVEFTQRLSTLETLLAEKDQEKTAFGTMQQEQIATYQRELEALQSLHSEQLSSAKQAAAVIEKAEESARQYEAKITELTCAVSELTRGQTVNAEEIAVYITTIETLEATCKEITVKFETLDHAFSEFKEQATVEMKNQLDNFMIAQIEMNQQNDDLKAQCETSSKALVNAQTMLEILQQKYDKEKEEHQNTHHEETQKYLSQIEKLQQEKIRCENELESAEKLQQKMDFDSKKFEEEKQILISQLQEFDEKVKKFNSEKEINEENAKQQDLQFENLQRIYHATAQQLQTLQTEYEMFKVQTSDNKTHFEELQRTQKQEFETQLKQTIDAENNKHLQSMKAAREEFDLMSEKDRTQHNLAIQTIQKELEQEIAQVHEKSQLLLQGVRKDFELEMERVRDMNKKEMTELVMKFQEKEELVLSHSHTFTEMQTTLETYKIQLEEAKAKYSALEEASCQLETSLKATQSSASTLAAEAQAGYEAKLAALSCRLAAVNAKHLACDGVIANLKEQLAKAHESAHFAQARATEDLLVHHSSELKTVRGEMESQISTLLESQRGLEERLQQAQEQHEETLLQSREDFNDTLSNLKERHQQQVEASVRVHKQQLSQLEDKLSTLQQAYDLTNTQLVEAQNEIKELSERVSKVPEQALKSESDSVQKKAVKEYEAELTKLKKQHSVELMKVSHKVKMEANKDNEIERKQAIEVAEAALEDRLRHEFSRETEKLKKELAKQNEMHSKKLESALTVRRPFQEMNTASLANAQEDVHLERMVQEANQQNKAIQLKRTENPGTFLLGVRRLHLSVIGGVLSVRIGGGFITFPEFVKKYGKDEGQRIFDNAVDENAEWASVSTKYGLDENKPAEQEDDNKPKKARKSLALDSKTASAVKERAAKFRRRSVAPS